VRFSCSDFTSNLSASILAARQAPTLSAAASPVGSGWHGRMTAQVQLHGDVAGLSSELGEAVAERRAAKRMVPATSDESFLPITTTGELLERRNSASALTAFRPCQPQGT